MATGQKVSVTETSPLTEEGCNHHWVIDSPSGGPTSTGTCRICGEVKEFRNAMGEVNMRGNLIPLQAIDTAH